MHKRVLETERNPLAVFRPDRVQGTIAPSGASDLILAGVVVVHGVEHALAVPVRVETSGDTVSAVAVFEIPYVAWGLHNPSFLFLQVAPVAAVTVRTVGDLRSDAVARGRGRAQ
jgi:hypothetical protein